MIRKKADRKSIMSLHEDYPGKPGFLGCYHQKSWRLETRGVLVAARQTSI